MVEDILQNRESNIRVMVIGVGGASCSGKTTLAKHMRSLMPSSFIVHQDDFAPPQELVPLHPIYGIQDWDDPEGAIQWPRMAKELEYVKHHGRHSDDYKTHDHLNKQTPVPVEDEIMMKWRARFVEIEDHFMQKRGERIIWALVDGFLLYWEPDVFKSMDVKLFLRVPEGTLKDRRDQRDGYITDAAEGGMWKDPPLYFEQIVYPAYVKAHRDLFDDGNVENGRLNEKIPDLILFDGSVLGMTDIVEKTCESIEQAVKEIDASI